MKRCLGIDCGSVSLNLALLTDEMGEPLTVYRRTRGRPLAEFVSAVEELVGSCAADVAVDGLLVTGSGRELLAEALGAPSVNEITAHATGAYWTNPAVRTIVEIGGQDSKFIKVEPPLEGRVPRVPTFRMNELCAAGTGAFLDEQAERLGVDVELFGPTALQSSTPAPIAGRCAVFAKTDMIHQAQEGTPIPDILLGLAFALVRNYMATLIKGEPIDQLVFLQGGVMSNAAVVHAFRQLIGLQASQILVPPNFMVMGAIGCAVLAARNLATRRISLARLGDLARTATCSASSRSWVMRLDVLHDSGVRPENHAPDLTTPEGPLVMGLDIGSVSVKGVIIDARGRIVKSHYKLSRSRVLEAVEETLEALGADACTPEVISVTGSGRYLVGRLVDADLILDEITAQATAAASHSSEVETVVEIGGQDSKWIVLEHGFVKDFEMNRVCAAGTGSFLTAQAERLDLAMGEPFSDAAFAAAKPADLGNRCTVFMESDLVHHQNNGASRDDLAAGVCISIVHNYLERVANHKPLGRRVLFLGGVAATDAVRAAFEQQTGSTFETPHFFLVSGALGAALKASDKLKRGEISPNRRGAVVLRHEQITRDQFTCNRCPNRCPVSKYDSPQRTVFHGGLCDRWEVEDRPASLAVGHDPFAVRVGLLEEPAKLPAQPGERAWGMIRAPQFYEWFPFWKSFCHELGIRLIVAPRIDRRQFQNGIRFLRVETCLPMKAMAGQIEDLVKSGVTTLFHPTILNERLPWNKDTVLEYCPYIQASSLFFKDAFPVEWLEPTVSFALDDDSFRREHVRFSLRLGFARRRIARAIEAGQESMESYNARLRSEGELFLNSLGSDEHAIIVLGKPYHTADSFLNMNLGSVFRRLDVRALPSDLYPLDKGGDWPNVYWKYQGNMIRVAREIARHPCLFPVLITFFGCGPDPFTLRHIRDNLGGKPLLVLEMDEHSSRSGIVTRVAAFLEQVRHVRHKQVPRLSDTLRYKAGDRTACKDSFVHNEEITPTEPTVLHEESGDRAIARSLRPVMHRLPRAEILYLPYMCEHSYGFAAAARSVGIDARVLPPPDQESEQLGRPHTVGGECHPYSLILGDYLKLAQRIPRDRSARSLFYILGPTACRLGQFPVYIDKIRRNLGLDIGVIWEVDQGLAAFGVSERNRQKVYLRGWESLLAYDALLRVFLQIRPYAKYKALTDDVFIKCRDKLFRALCEGRVRQGLEEVLHDLGNVALGEVGPKPVVAVTGDYYTRVVPYANNDAYREIEALGGLVLCPPTFSDCLKMATLRDLMWNLMNRQFWEAATKASLYVLLAFSEFKVKGTSALRNSVAEPWDLSGHNMWRTVSQHAATRLPAGITAPIATGLNHADLGAHGVLNLMTLNCSYGTVVTATLARALKRGPGIPMLTLVYDGLKKTNEKTRLQAFMEQVNDRFRTDLAKKRPKQSAVAS